MVHKDHLFLYSFTIEVVGLYHVGDGCKRKSVEGYTKVGGLTGLERAYN